MTEPKKKFEDRLPPEDKRLYSVNFLLAGLSPTGDLRREERLMENTLPSRHYQNRDFATSRFPKNISTPLSRFPPVAEDDE